MVFASSISTTALGIHVRHPRLSWRLPDGSANQVAYRIRTDNGWDTGRVDSDASILVAVRRARRWLRGSGSSGRSRCGPTAARATGRRRGWFELGLLDAEDWQAEWIEPG